MLDLIEKAILPGLQGKDWNATAWAIGRYGELAGEIFRPIQGDAYRTPRIRFLIDLFRSHGFHGCGQSSWGPTIFAIAQDPEQAAWLVNKVSLELEPGATIEIAQPAGPAQIERSLVAG